MVCEAQKQVNGQRLEDSAQVEDQTAEGPELKGRRNGIGDAMMRGLRPRLGQ